MDLKISEVHRGSTRIIEPIPGYVLKSSTANGKLLVNVCYSDLIESPNNSNGESVRVPMSVSAVFQEYDKSGQSCDVVDVIVSGTFFNMSVSMQESRVAFHRLVGNSIEQKHGLSTLSEFKVIRRKYMGDKVRPQCVRVSRSVLIKELSPEETPGSQIDTVDSPAFEMLYRNPADNQSIDVLKLNHLCSTAEHLQEAMVRAFSGESEPALKRQSLEEALGDKSELILVLEDVANPSLYRLRVTNQRVHVSKSGMERRGFHIWFPRLMDPSTVLVKYNQSEKKIILTMRMQV